MSHYAFTQYGKGKRKQVQPPRASKRYGSYPKAIAWISAHLHEVRNVSFAVDLVSEVFGYPCHQVEKDVLKDVLNARLKAEKETPC